jgi:hypothetical protein
VICRKKKINNINKIAILISSDYINYKKKKLYSSENNIVNMTDLLKNYLNYTNIFFIKNYSKEEIIIFFKWFIKKYIDTNNIIFFYFTGHGCKNGLLTEDYKILYNYEIKKYFINKLSKNSRLFCLIDACESENVFNLSYNYYNYRWSRHYNYVQPYAKVIMLSACKKNQNTNDNIINGKYHSFITYIFIDIIKENINISWKELINKLKLYLIFYNFKQTPMISSSVSFNINNSINL